ncbi:MAG: hypothetical protein HZC49_06220 [Nitrospirae bacterium]|nr:hypothetical protein [Nitrospirota bacterium]
MKIGPETTHIRAGYFFLVAALLSALFWLFESALHATMFHGNSLYNDHRFIDYVFSPDKHELWMRLLVVSSVFLLSAYAHSFYRSRRVEKELINYQAHLGELVEERTSELQASNELLIEEIKDRQALEKSLIDIEDRERRLIGHDLHDGLGQLLTGLAFKIRGLGRKLEIGHFEGAEEAAELSVLIDEAKEQASYLSRGLSPIEMNEEGLMTALKALSSNTSKMFNIPCAFTCEGPVTIHNETALTQLYRIAQEAVTNALKYAQCDHIEISLRKNHDRIIMTIKDNGIGIPEHAARKGGMGLKIMNYRAGLINASLDIRHDTDGGTIITCAHACASEINELVSYSGRVTTSIKTN